ncbi:hypothetical protein [Phenylobacterium sp.]|jgi:hypothetical protein|uniref:hypothetical protein n=1 Tax=Phenylobacterium sp. TaxID=1871053 RepID=UPI002F9549A6
MAATDTALDHEAIARARALVSPPKPKERMWPVLAAAALAAAAALSFATAMILAPPLVTEHMAKGVD